LQVEWSEVMLNFHLSGSMLFSIRVKPYYNQELSIPRLSFRRLAVRKRIAGGIGL